MSLAAVKIVEVKRGKTSETSIKKAIPLFCRLKWKFCWRIYPKLSNKNARQLKVNCHSDKVIPPKWAMSEKLKIECLMTSTNQVEL